MFLFLHQSHHEYTYERVTHSSFSFGIRLFKLFSFIHLEVNSTISKLYDNIFCLLARKMHYLLPIHI